MGQKISPVALRLQTNKSFQASWYSQKFYAHFLQKQLQLQTFFKSGICSSRDKSNENPLCTKSRGS